MMACTRTGGCAGTRIASRDFADGEGVRLGKEAEGAGRYGELDGLARGCRIPRLLFFLLFLLFYLFRSVYRDCWSCFYVLILDLA